MSYPVGTVYMMRGLPGSGKSTLARKLVGPAGLVASTDDWHVDPDGVYRYKADRVNEAHAWNQRRFRAAVLARVPLIAVDNTNMRYSQMSPYIMFAELHGYRVVMVAVPTELTDEELSARSLHQVPAEVIAKMRAAWEPLENTMEAFNGDL